MSKEKDKKKDGQLVIRIDKQDKKRFLKLCEARDTSAGREIRQFIQGVLAAQQPPVTPTLPTAEAAPETAQDPAPTAVKEKASKPKAAKTKAEKTAPKEAEQVAP